MCSPLSHAAAMPALAPAHCPGSEFLGSRGVMSSFPIGLQETEGTHWENLDCWELREVPGLNKMIVEGLEVNEKGIQGWQGTEGRVRNVKWTGSLNDPTIQKGREAFRRGAIEGQKARSSGERPWERLSSEGGRGYYEMSQSSHVEKVRRNQWVWQPRV